MSEFTVLVAEAADAGNIHVMHVTADNLEDAETVALRAYWADETIGWGQIELEGYPFDPTNYIVHGVAHGFITFFTAA